jgi:hypothetical protein
MKKYLLAIKDHGMFTYLTEEERQVVADNFNKHKYQVAYSEVDEPPNTYKEFIKVISELNAEEKQLLAEIWKNSVWKRAEASTYKLYPNSIEKSLEDKGLLKRLYSSTGNSYRYDLPERLNGRQALDILLDGLTFIPKVSTIQESSDYLECLEYQGVS